MLGSAWFHLAAAFVVTGLLLSFVAKPYWVPSGSMEQTLIPDDRVLVNRLAFVGGGPSTGDIIVFDADETWSVAAAPAENPLKALLRRVGEWSGFGPTGTHTLVKRIIGTPGDTVECCSASGAVMVDGVALDEPYIQSDLAFEPGTLDCDTADRSYRCFGPVTVPDGAYLVLGDNRDASADSALYCRAPDSPEDCWRWARRDDIVGRAVAIIWPVTRWGAL